MTEADPLPRLVFAVALAALLGVGVCVARLEHAQPPRAPPLDLFGVTLTGHARPGALVIESLSSQGAAQQAGLAVGDVVEAVNGALARSQSEVDRDLRLRTPVDFRVRRGDTSLHFLIAEPENAFGQPHIVDRGRPVHG